MDNKFPQIDEDTGRGEHKRTGEVGILEVEP